MSEFKVVITDLRHKEYNIERDILKEINAELILKDCTTEAELIDFTRDADGVIVNLASITENVIKSMQSCKVISRYGVGYDNVDVKAASVQNIIVTNVPDYCEEEVSDQALALLLSCVRKTAISTARIIRGEWNIEESYKISRIKGKVFGFIGYGRMAKAVHRKLMPFSLQTYLAYDPYLTEEIASQNNINKVSFEQLLQESDYISINVPLSDETENLLGEREFSLMKSNVILINTARGGIVDEAALYSALKNNKINSAGLDVFAEEPLKKDNPLLELENVVLTDHNAWYSEESMAELKAKAAKNVREVLLGRAPLYKVNP